MQSTEYKCAECGAPATVDDGLVVRSCEHEGAVTASVSATVYGQATLAKE